MNKFCHLFSGFSAIYDFIMVPGLLEEIAKREFADWSFTDLSKFIYDPTNPLPNLKQPTPEDLRLIAAMDQLQRLAKQGEGSLKAHWSRR
jgi:hypothetical protein